MQARMVTQSAKPGHVEALAAFWDEQTVSDLMAQQGNRGFFLFTDAANDRVIGLSLWDSPEDADATAATFRGHMQAIAEHLAAPPSPAALNVAVSRATASVA